MPWSGPVGAAVGDSAYQGMEIQVLDNEGKAYKKDGVKWIKPEQHHGSIYDVVAAKQGFLKPVGEWNEEEIRADGTRITVTLNGMAVPRSMQHTNGWDYSPDAMTITFFGTFCDSIRSGAVGNGAFAYGCPGPVID